jgi:DNA-binding PadR family transcriptional regulator
MRPPSFWARNNASGIRRIGRGPDDAMRAWQASMDETFLFGGLIRLHVLRHAAREPIYGLAMIQELVRRGYRLSAGTLYPVLHGMEERGLLVSEQVRVGRVRRRIYRATPAGISALAAAKQRARQLLAARSEDEAVPVVRPARRPRQPARGAGG